MRVFIIAFLLLASTKALSDNQELKSLKYCHDVLFYNPFITIVSEMISLRKDGLLVFHLEQKETIVVDTLTDHGKVLAGYYLGAIKRGYIPYVFKLSDGTSERSYMGTGIHIDLSTLEKVCEYVMLTFKLKLTSNSPSH